MSSCEGKRRRRNTEKGKRREREREDDKEGKKRIRREKRMLEEIKRILLEEGRGCGMIERSRHITRSDKEGVRTRSRSQTGARKKAKGRHEEGEGRALAPLGAYHLLRSSSSSGLLYVRAAFRSHTDTMVSSECA